MTSCKKPDCNNGTCAGDGKCRCSVNGKCRYSVNGKYRYAMIFQVTNIPFFNCIDNCRRDKTLLQSLVNEK